VTLTHKQLFERYVFAGPISRDPDAMAELFTEDGVLEAPLVPDGHALPRRLEGRESIRTGVTAYHREPAFQGKVDTERTGYVLHETADPDVFIAEIDAVVDGATVSLVQIFRVRDGRISVLRDYFAV
jgi:ketosteroid isomerase-like protein